MLKVRIIPTLLCKDGLLFKGVGFNSWRRVGSILPAIKVYNQRQVDELIVVDITATQEKRGPDFESVKDFSSECFVPLTVGGGVRTVDDIEKLLKAGADKVSINSAAYNGLELITQGAARFGSQCIVASVDVRVSHSGEYICYSNSGTRDTGQEVISWVRRVQEHGAGEILLTSIERDGTMQGYDLALIQQVTQTVSIPVIASGGAGSYEDIYQAITIGKVSAVGIASMFHFTEQTPLEAKYYLAKKNIPVRLPVSVTHGLRSGYQKPGFKNIEKTVLSS